MNTGMYYEARSLVSMRDRWKESICIPLMFSRCLLLVHPLPKPRRNIPGHTFQESILVTFFAAVLEALVMNSNRVKSRCNGVRADSTKPDVLSVRH